MKAKELREKSLEELIQLKKEITSQIVDFRVKKSIGDTTEKPMKIRIMRRDLARVNTLIRDRELKKNG